MAFNHGKISSQWDHQDFTPLSSLPAENIFNRHRSYAADFECLSDVFLAPSVDDSEKVFSPFPTQKEDPLYFQASNEICRDRNDGEVESRVGDYASIDEYDGFRVHHEDLRDAPPDETAQLRLERIHARLAPRCDQKSLKQDQIIWTECKHWALSFVEETDRYIQWELRQKGDQACLTLYDEEAYFALLAIIDCSESPRKLIFELSSRSSQLLEADCMVVVQDLLCLLESKTMLRGNQKE